MADKGTLTIDAKGGAATLINIYEIAPEKQAELVHMLEEATEKVMRRQPGFVSVAIHRSLDGARVANYAQWASREEFDRMLQNPEAQAQMKRFASLAKSVSPVLYQATSVHVR